ncbi:MAG TPA: PAS domain-containing protein, partial [Methylophilus sp.]
MATLHHSISSSLVVKTTLKILLASALISILISSVAIYLIRGYQTQVLNERITQLATTVENTAAIAAFTSDAELAKEVAHGLLTNNIVSNVRISSVLPSKKSLVLTALPGKALASNVVAYQRELYSPFNAAEIVGILEVWLKPSEVKKEAASYSVLVTVSLFCVVFSITWILIQVINLSVIHPIKRISDDMHALDLSKEHLLSSPKNTHHDEIGRLVGDINALIQRLKSLLSTEKALRLSKELSEQRLRMIFDKSQTGIFLMDDHQRLISWNPALLNMLGIYSQALQVHNAPTLTQLLPQHADLLNGMIMNLFATNHSVSMTVPIETGNRTSWIEISMMALDR